MSYRPFTDVWILARPKSKYFGAYPAGFLRRARDLIGCSQEDQVLHVCSGDIANYKCGPGCSGNDRVARVGGDAVPGQVPGNDDEPAGLRDPQYARGPCDRLRNNLYVLTVLGIIVAVYLDPASISSTILARRGFPPRFQDNSDHAERDQTEQRQDVCGHAG
jgi:hypothetical protein